MGLLQKARELLTKSRRSVVKSTYSSLGGVVSETGDKYPLDYYLEDPLVFGAIQNKANWIISAGFDFISLSGNQNEVKSRAMWALQKGFTHKLYNWVRSNLLWADVYVEIDPPRQDFYVLDTDTITAEYDEKGRPIRYIQEANGKRVVLSPEKVIHFTSNVIGSELKGISPLTSIKDVVKYKKTVEEYTQEFFRRNATPRMHIKVAKEGKTDEQLKDLSEELEKLSPHGDIITTDDIEIKPVGSNIVDIQFGNYLEYLQRQETFALNMYPILLGMPEGSNKASSEVQLKAFAYHVKAKQAEVEFFVNTMLFPKLFGDDNDVLIKFREVNTDDLLKKATVKLYLGRAYSQLAKTGVLSPEQAQQMFLEEVDKL